MLNWPSCLKSMDRCQDGPKSLQSMRTQAKICSSIAKSSRHDPFLLLNMQGYGRHHCSLCWFAVSPDVGVSSVLFVLVSNEYRSYFGPWIFGQRRRRRRKKTNKKAKLKARKLIQNCRLRAGLLVSDVPSSANLIS